MYCTHCGKKVTEAQNFCAHCGTPNTARKTPESPLTTPEHCERHAPADPEGPAELYSDIPTHETEQPSSEEVLQEEHAREGPPQAEQPMFSSLLGSEKQEEERSEAFQFDPPASEETPRQQAPAFSSLVGEPQSSTTTQQPAFFGTFKRVPWGLVLLWNLLTFWVYWYFWLFLRIKKFNTLESEVKFPTFMAFFNFLLFLTYLFLSGMAGAFEGLEMQRELAQVEMANLPIYLLYTITYIWINFRIRRILLNHEQSHGNRSFKVFWLWTFLFGNIHLQHKINTLIDRDETRTSLKTTLREAASIPLVQSTSPNASSSESTTDEPQGGSFPKV